MRALLLVRVASDANRDHSPSRRETTHVSEGVIRDDMLEGVEVIRCSPRPVERARANELSDAA
jgi:hypothetical protein